MNSLVQDEQAARSSVVGLIRIECSSCRSPRSAFRRSRRRRTQVHHAALELGIVPEAASKRYVSALQRLRPALAGLAGNRSE
jgi:hypothetical protein